MAKRRSNKLSDQIRQVIDDSGLTRYRIAKDIGMNESALSKFYLGHRGISTTALDRLADYLGLNITTGKPRKRKSR